MPPLSEDKPLTCRQSVLIQATQYPHQVFNPHSSSIYSCFPNTWLSIFTQLSWRQHVEVSCVEIFWVKWRQDKDEMLAVQGQSVLWWWVHISHEESSEDGAQYHIWSVDEHRKTSIMRHAEQPEYITADHSSIIPSVPAEDSDQDKVKIYFLSLWFVTVLELYSYINIIDNERMCSDPFYKRLFLPNFKWIELSFCCHHCSDKAIATKFCTFYDSCAIGVYIFVVTNRGLFY